MSNDVEKKRELNDLIRLVGNLSENHLSVLQRHEELFCEAYKSAQSHAAAITALRADVKRFADVVSEQNQMITMLRESVLKIQHTLALPDDDLTPPAPSAPN